MSTKQLILINHTGFYLPLAKALEEQGFQCLWDAWNPSREQLAISTACFIWFYDVLRYPFKVYALKQKLNKYNIPLIAWNRDAPHYLNRKAWRLNLFNHIQLLDIYATHTLIDKKRTFAKSRLYLPNAANIEQYNLHGNKNDVLTNLRIESNYKYDVSFFGGMDGKRYKEDLEREIFFKHLSVELDKRGISYQFIEMGDKKISIEQQIALIQSSKINLNYGARCEYKAPIASGLPERCFGIPAVGGFLLCDKRTHTKDHFRVGKHMDEFSSIDECLLKIEQHLDNFKNLRTIAECGYHHVVQHHTYANRATTLLNAIQAWHDEERGLLQWIIQKREY